MGHLHTQKYLLSGKTPEDLKEELGIKFYEHPELPLVGFKYCQINSTPRDHPIVRECRGLVLERGTWNVVAKGFSRFFNVGEYADEFKRFNWSDFDAYSKEDGSLIIAYHYEDEWHINTSGSFGLGPLDSFGGSWRDLFWNTAPFSMEDLKSVNTDTTLVFELCTPYNKVVRSYRSTVYLLGAFDHGSGSSDEICQYTVDSVASKLGTKRPERYSFGSQDEVKDFLLGMEEKDSTFEGVILLDSNGMRYKWKTQTYLSLHRMKDNGNVLHPKNLVPIVLSGETPEVKAIMPECVSALDEVTVILEEAFEDLEAKWVAGAGATSQKEFALIVKDHKMAGLLFKLRKINPDALSKDLADLWRESEDQILKTFFATKRFKFDVVEVK